MHDIWNPWHGCEKVSEGCAHCYMYYLDSKRGASGNRVYRTQNFDYPLSCRRGGGYKIVSGEQLRVCMTSDFFLDSADQWRDAAWRIMKMRSDVKFFLLTKRPGRVASSLPPDWGDGWENVMLNVSCENMRRADERIPLLLELPFKHKGIMAAPLVGALDIGHYLATGMIEQVVAGGENYDGSRPCDFDWIKSLSAQCVRHDVTFCFIETGTNFIKDGRHYTIVDKRVQSEMARKANVNHVGRQPVYRLRDPLGFEIAPEALYKPVFSDVCRDCGSRPICNGCAHCAVCTCRR